MLASGAEAGRGEAAPDAPLPAPRSPRDRTPERCNGASRLAPRPDAELRGPEAAAGRTSKTPSPTPPRPPSPRPDATPPSPRPDPRAARNGLEIAVAAAVAAMDSKGEDKRREAGYGVAAAPVKEEWFHAPLHMLEPVPAQPAVPKRRRTVLSIAEKADLIRRLHSGESQRQLALEYGIGTSTVSDVKKHEVEILKYVETNGDFVAMTRRKLESGAKADVEEAVFEWLLQEVRCGRELAGTEVMARARAEHQRLRGNDDFRASTGWLERFKRRYNIRAFRPGEEGGWRPIVQRAGGDDARAQRGKRRGRPPLTRPAEKARAAAERLCKGRALDLLERVLEGASSPPPPRVKTEPEAHDEYDYGDMHDCDDDLSPETQHSLQPLVSLEEGHVALDIPPVEEIPSAGEAAALLAKALVWAAAQPDTTPQELYVMKQLQTKAALSCHARASH
ncbi:tigger transposable element-derived protein 5 [Penaeus vannamei]|uniref:tigger transposable element-derived protein 5 n=1 Tax=Penaeus vannamei TaxID=6689 RepID=UPI00387F7575